MVGELPREQRFPVDLVVVGPESGHRRVELELLDAPGAEQTDSHLLGAELEVREHEALVATSGQHEGLEVQGVEVAVDLAVGSRPPGEVAAVGGLVGREVVGVDAGQQEHVGDAAFVFDLEPHRLDVVVVELDAEDSASLVATQHRRGDRQAAARLCGEPLAEGHLVERGRVEGREGAAARPTERAAERPDRDDESDVDPRDRHSWPPSRGLRPIDHAQPSPRFAPRFAPSFA